MAIKRLQIKITHYIALLKQNMDRIIAVLLSQRARPLRFVFTGGLCGLIQLVVFTLLEHNSWQPLIANAVAFLLSAQVNFLFSISFTWGDRLTWQQSGLLKHWLVFHGSILGTALLNQLVFLLSHLLLPNQLAVVLGIGVAALANFALLDRQVFRQGSIASWRKIETEQKLEKSNFCRK